MRGLCCDLGRPGYTELGKAELVCLSMIDRKFEVRGGSRHYSRWPYLWRPEDEWGPITAAVVFAILLAGLMAYVAVVQL